LFSGRRFFSFFKSTIDFFAASSATSRFSSVSSDVIFEKGTTDKSYGIQVGKLAGLPKEVIERAKQVYDKLEMVENDLGQSDVRSLKSEVAKRKKTITLPGQEQVSLF